MRGPPRDVRSRRRTRPRSSTLLARPDPVRAWVATSTRRCSSRRTPSSWPASTPASRSAARSADSSLASRAPVLDAAVAAGLEDTHVAESVAEVIEQLRRGLRVLLTPASRPPAGRGVARARRPFAAARARHPPPGAVLRRRAPQPAAAEGHLDRRLRLAIEAGFDPVTAVQMATINAASAHAARPRPGRGGARALRRPRDPRRPAHVRGGSRRAPRPCWSPRGPT